MAANLGAKPVGEVSSRHEAYFRSKVMVTDSCHVWDGVFRPSGHGQISFNRGKRTLAAHRVAYALAFGDPGGQVVRHKCDNPWCVAPYHLELGSAADNVRDAFERGQLNTRGAKSPMHRLGKGRFDEEKVRDVRRRLASGERQGAIARIYGTTSAHIAAIRKGEKWGWVV